MKKLESLFKKLENKIEYSTVLNPEVSKGSVGWHIEHILLTTSLIIRAIEKSNSLDYKSKFNFVKMCVFSPQNEQIIGIVTSNLKNFETRQARHYQIFCHNKHLESMQK